MPSLGKLSAKLGLDNTELEQKARESEGTLKRMSARMRDVVNRAGTVGVALGAVGVAIAVNLVRQGGEAARELRNLASVSQTSTREFQRNAYAAKQFGIEQEKLSDIYKDASDRVGDFLTTGAGPMADFFEQIAPKVGVTADEFRGLSGPQVMQKYVQTLQDANVSQQEMTFFMEQMASDSSRLIPLLRDNAAELNRMGDNAEDLGMVLSQIELDRLEQADQAMDDLAGAMSGLATTATAAMAPALQAIADGLNEELKSALQDSEDDVISWGQVTGDILAFSADAALSAIKVIGGGFSSVGQTIGAGFSEGVARIKGETDSADAIAAEWRDNMAGIFSGVVDANATRFRDRLAEIREEAERMRGIEEITITRGRRTTNAKDTTEQDAAREAAEKQAEIEAERIRQTEEREAALLQGRLDRLTEFVASEAEIEAMRHKTRLEELEAAEAAGLEVEGGFMALREELEAEHMDRLEAIRKEGLSNLEKFTAMSYREQAQEVSKHLADMTAGVAHESRAMFEINKAAGIANAIINTAQGVTQALAAYPPPISFAMAAAQAAAGVAQISAIKSQSFGGSGSAPSLAGSTPAPPTTPVSGGIAEDRKVIAVEGINADQLFSGQAVRGLLEQLQGAVDDGAKLVITP